MGEALCESPLFSKKEKHKMKKTITINEKEMTFKSSAATNILYKKAFGEDILVKLTAYTKNLKELKNMQDKIAEMKEDTTKSQEEKLAVMNEIMNSNAFLTSQSFSSNELPKLAYIMYIEANETQATIFDKLNESSYLSWLMDIDQDELLTVTGQVMDVWQAGAKTHSKPKN